jgi:intracellular sulfur oxidation DsrE/DsrF family protein
MSWLPLARRSFLSHVGTGVSAVFGANLVGGVATLQAQSTGKGRPEPGRHPQDDWFDQLPGQHRLVLDATTANGFGGALLYANNFLIASQAGYGLKDSDSAVIIVVRHFATVFAYNDAIWAKYGATISQRINFNDGQTQQPAKINVYNSASHAAALPSLGNTLDGVLKRGVHIAVCQMATRLFSDGLAQAAGGTADAVYKEIVGNLVANSHMVPAGIVAINRAQERGYAFASAG